VQSGHKLLPCREEQVLQPGKPCEKSYFCCQTYYANIANTKRICMPLITNVKMGGVNNLSDARFAAGCEVDFIGFCLDSADDRRISIEEVQEIANWVEGPAMVAEFGGEDPGTINAIMNKLGFEWLQLPAGYPHETSALHGQIFRKVFLDSLTDGDRVRETMDKIAEGTDFFVLESNPARKATTLKESEIDFLAGVCRDFPVFIGLNFEITGIRSLLKKIHPAGIHIAGEDEVSPGYRDFDELIDLLEALEE
jgi:phosphoribosylanthranilate isomerase